MEYLLNRLTSRNPRGQVNVTPNLNPISVPSYHDRGNLHHPLPHGGSFVDGTNASQLPDTPPESPAPSPLSPTPSQSQSHPRTRLTTLPARLPPPKTTTSTRFATEDSDSDSSADPPLSPGPPAWTQPLHLVDTTDGLSIYSHVHGDDERTKTFCVYCFRMQGRFEKMDAWGECVSCGRAHELEGVFYVDRGEG